MEKQIFQKKLNKELTETSSWANWCFFKTSKTKSSQQTNLTAWLDVPLKNASRKVIITSFIYKKQIYQIFSLVTCHFVLSNFNLCNFNRCQLNLLHFQPLAISTACIFDHLQFQPPAISTACNFNRLQFQNISFSSRLFLFFANVLKLIEQNQSAAK